MAEMAAQIEYCRFCNSAFRPKRKAQKFCREGCRRQFWTVTRRTTRELVGEAIGILKKIESLYSGV